MNNEDVIMIKSKNRSNSLNAYIDKNIIYTRTKIIKDNECFTCFGTIDNNVK